MNADAKKRYKDIHFPFICPVSNRTFESGQGLSCYVTKTLKVEHSEYYDKYVNHRDNSCFFCGSKGKFISISKGYRNLCDQSICVKKSFSSHTVEGFMYRNNCSREEAEKLFQLENKRQLEERTKTQNKLREEDPLWDKKRSRNCPEFWIEKGLSKEEADIEVKKVMDEIHKKTSKKLKSNPGKYASKYPTKIEYWTSRGQTIEDAKKRISEIQNRFSLKKCVEKYGLVDGEMVFLERQQRWQKSLQNGGNVKGGYSKISQTLFYDIIRQYNKRDIKNVYFWTKNKEFMLKSTKSVFLYDFTDIEKRKIIEYNGDQYHANPLIYDRNDTPHPYHKEHHYTAEKIWEKDRIKTELANKNGFEVLIVWDSEYRKNPQQIVEKCIRFINE